MGNWMTVSLRGSLASEDVAAAREFITVLPDYSNFHCLSQAGGLSGLGDWVGEEIHADGNLAERNYGVTSIVETLRKLVSVAPSLTLKVHCGGDYESTKCHATVTVAGGQVSEGPPEVAEVSGVSQEVFQGRLFGAIVKGSGS